MIELDKGQIRAIKELRNGKILCGGTGSGKTRTALAYYFFRVCGGNAPVNGKSTWELMKKPRDLYVITTAKKRDSLDWEKEALYFHVNSDSDLSINGVTITVDSWNNIWKYVNIFGAFFIFDEQRVTGSGPWVKAFYKITKKNQWVLLSATPGDVWKDYIPVFVANGFYRNKTDFLNQHAIFSRFTKFTKIEGYRDEPRLLRFRDHLLVDIDVERTTVPHHIDKVAQYDRKKYLTVVKERWNPYDDEPIREPSKLCSLMRRVVNEDPSRLEIIKELWSKHEKTIIFYNYNFELEELKELAANCDMPFAQWNGHKHEEVPEGDRWTYLVNYEGGAEGWNCIRTDTIIFFSLNYSYRKMIQAEGRIDRRNTKYIDLYYYHIISKASIDKAIRAAIIRKENFNESRFLSK